MENFLLGRFSATSCLSFGLRHRTLRRNNQGDSFENKGVVCSVVFDDVQSYGFNTQNRTYPDFDLAATLFSSFDDNRSRDVKNSISG